MPETEESSILEMKLNFWFLQNQFEKIHSHTSEWVLQFNSNSEFLLSAPLGYLAAFDFFPFAFCSL